MYLANIDLPVQWPLKWFVCACACAYVC